MNGKAKKPIEVIDRSFSQINLLQKMSEGTLSTREARQYQIQELAAVLNSDEREVQRTLYILEGHKFVAPCPAGDFTSKTWQITEGGLNVVKGSGAPRLF